MNFNRFQELVNDAEQGGPSGCLERWEAVLRFEEAVQLSAQMSPEQVAEARRQVARVKPLAYLRLGQHHAGHGKPDLALQYLKKSHELEPGRYEVHLALGKAYLANEMGREAIGEFQEVMRIAPEHSAEAYEMLGEVFVRQERPPQTTRVWFQHAAELYMKQGELEKARSVSQRIVELGGEPVALPPSSGGGSSMDEWLSGRG